MRWLIACASSVVLVVNGVLDLGRSRLDASINLAQLWLVALARSGGVLPELKLSPVPSAETSNGKT